MYNCKRYYETRVMTAFNIEDHKENIEAYVQLVNDTYDPENGDVYPDMSEFVANVADSLNMIHLIRRDTDRAGGIGSSGGDDAFDKAWNSIADVISQVAQC